MIEIFEAIKESAKRIKTIIEMGDSSKSDSSNSTGDTQLKLDIASDLVIEEIFGKIPSVKQIVSEEKDEIFTINPDGKYLIAYDPLDGSSLVDVNLSVGTIYGIYENDFTGSNLKASAYIVYGPNVDLVFCDGKVSKLYRLRNNHFVFLKDIKLNPSGKFVATGSTQQCWYPHHKKMVDDMFESGYKLRYSGGMVPDLHQILVKGGGLFSYPGASDKPKGKLRQLFEVFPFALIFECAGGGAIDGQNRVLEAKTLHIHDTSPCFFGSVSELVYVTSAYNG
ncbi:class 1 fructose-bisphosphatase [Arcobacter sp. FWKO B]|uniref:class 1 fructose-bisphosphatase n=1 Tax=Arcobacter sp. FWKO B TaxID=2593672 RepID=UPI0018A5DED8|nr:class 1 fructose-bisphosphatase [Arcobacter sp. FWKO B]QOG11350.1 class 1 fructose-bisphosphatase [Arcobacter sp. FWKO B]